MTRYFVAISLFAFALSSPAYSSDTGNETLEMCTWAVKSADKVKLTPEQSVRAAYCGGYLGGILDGLALAQLSGAKRVVCTPESGISVSQLARIVVKHLREHPEVLHEGSRVQILIALNKSFPCN